MAQRTREAVLYQVESEPQMPKSSTGLPFRESAPLSITRQILFGQKSMAAQVKKQHPRVKQAYLTRALVEGLRRTGLHANSARPGVQQQVEEERQFRAFTCMLSRASCFGPRLHRLRCHNVKILDSVGHLMRYVSRAVQIGPVHGAACRSAVLSRSS